MATTAENCNNLIRPEACIEFDVADVCNALNEYLVARDRGEKARASKIAVLVHKVMAELSSPVRFNISQTDACMYQEIEGYEPDAKKLKEIDENPGVFAADQAYPIEGVIDLRNSQTETWVRIQNGYIEEAKEAA